MTVETVHEAALRRWADGYSPTAAAATELLIRTGFAEPGNPWVHADNWIDFDRIEGNIGELPGGQQRVLRIAASLFGSVPIALGTEVAGIDRSYLELVLAAISHVHGEGADMVQHAGGEASIAKLPVAYPWPGD